MLRKSFRLGLKLGLLVGAAIAVAKVLQSRSERDLIPAEPPGHTGPWPPLPDTRPSTRAEQPSAPEPWVEPGNDGTCPSSHPVKAKLSSKIFHLPGMLNYDRTNPDRCYVDAAAAEVDGLRAAKR